MLLKHKQKNNMSYAQEENYDYQNGNLGTAFRMETSSQNIYYQWDSGLKNCPCKRGRCRM